MRSVAIAVVALVAAGAVAQDPDPRYVIHIEVDRPILEPGESATITMRAGFDADADYAIANLGTDLLFMDPATPAFFQDLEVLPPMDTLFENPGEATSLGVEGIIAVQLQWHDSRADRTDPMPFWMGELAIPATIAAPIRIDLFTETMYYQAYEWPMTASTVTRVDELVEGSATITIVACRADFNEDGAADLFDFLAFMNAFDAGDPLADFDFDGELTLFDFLAFQDRFDQGCS